MNEFDTLTDLVGSNVIDLIQSFADEQIENFADQIKYLDLDPKKDFRYSDLSFMSFGDCDLRGFDFTGSNLTGVTGTGAKWDHTTKLDDANLTASIFSYYQHSQAYFESNPN